MRDLAQDLKGKELSDPTRFSLHFFHSNKQTSQMVFSREELTAQRWMQERPERREFLAKPSQSLSPTGPANHLVPFP